MFKNSYFKISADGRPNHCYTTIDLNDIEFYPSNWEFNDVNISMTNCNTSLLYMNVNSCAKKFQFFKFFFKSKYSQLHHWMLDILMHKRCPDFRL